MLHSSTVALLRFVLSAGLLCGTFASARAEERLLVHAWGTFTSLQDESGQPIGGINIEDVSIPEPLHAIAPGSLLPVGEGGETIADKPLAHTHVTMRLEKVVVNFYPAPDFDWKVHVEARFHDGWLRNIPRERSSNRRDSHATISARFLRGCGAAWNGKVSG